MLVGILTFFDVVLEARQEVLMAKPTGQNEWRFCNKCFCLFWNGEAQKGVCPAGPPGSGHNATGSWDFVLAANPVPFPQPE
jgi:hypothetical protein